ncbi:hypothetical protein [Maribacter sp.]|uniref:hypothetical protein n=1 Tax=Maribacter sp. TaxID=1897614 RepID=UPI0025C0F8FB|nr:hypothetical protein [Maribacter sp.]
MEILQNILVYLTLAVAVGFMMKKFFLPKPVKSQKKGFEKSCGQSGSCGCN